MIKRFCVEFAEDNWPAAVHPELHQPNHLQLYVQKLPAEHAHGMQVQLPLLLWLYSQAQASASGVRHGYQKWQWCLWEVLTFDDHQISCD